ncbi:hypothetical protein [Methanosarcina horonobensis]|uniref:hypothetical protein n=1 Tax=Methanosarcina horonobensis TaxID=418008 RepID=UPI0013011821|nr:hypothetical protein [Methanosarcina horonobensis]
MGEGVPISVKIGGPNIGLSVTLFRDDLDGLKDISSIVLYPNNSSTQLNNSLIGNSIGSGKYLVFLNTTSLPTGHYKLVFENPKYEWINSSSPFIILQCNFAMPDYSPEWAV